MMLKSIIERRILHRLFVNYVSQNFLKYSVSTSLNEQVDRTDFVQSFLKKNPKITQDKLASFYNNVSTCSLPVEIVPELLKKCPDLVRIPSERFNETLLTWLDINLGSEFIELITINPSVLFLSKRQIETRYQSLAELFGKKPVAKIFINSPIVLTEPLEDIKMKVDYLEQQLKYSKAEITKSGALSCTYRKIKLRFEFLRKTGAFKVPKKKTLLADKMVNPNLSQVLFLNNHDFANQVAGVSLFEFKVFQEMSNEEDSDYEDPQSFQN